MLTMIWDLAKSAAVAVGLIKPIMKNVYEPIYEFFAGEECNPITKMVTECNQNVCEEVSRYFSNCKTVLLKEQIGVNVIGTAPSESFELGDNAQMIAGTALTVAAIMGYGAYCYYRQNKAAALAVPLAAPAPANVASGDEFSNPEPTSAYYAEL